MLPRAGQASSRAHFSPRCNPEHGAYWIASSLDFSQGREARPNSTGCIRSEPLRPAQRNAEVDRLERGRAAAPAAIGFLERERLLNPQFARN
jgi:hypothetical protein